MLLVIYRKEQTYKKNKKNFEKAFSYKPQSKVNKCFRCSSFLHKCLSVIWKDCCECKRCGKFMIIDIDNLKRWGLWRF